MNHIAFSRFLTWNKTVAKNILLNAVCISLWQIDRCSLDALWFYLWIWFSAEVLLSIPILCSNDYVDGATEKLLGLAHILLSAHLVLFCSVLSLIANQISVSLHWNDIVEAQLQTHTILSLFYWCKLVIVPFCLLLVGIDWRVMRPVFYHMWLPKACVTIEPFLPSLESIRYVWLMLSLSCLCPFINLSSVFGTISLAKIDCPC